MPTNLLPILLVAHITLAVALFLPSILLPFTLRTRRSTRRVASSARCSGRSRMEPW
jgi:hypothetical protein